jgi:tetratricopeptide (TPR) repeat protein
MVGREAGPYVGLRPYEVDDAPRFFGRSRETRELTSLLLGSRLVVVYGPSGVGKTSLLQAGVLAGLGSDLAQVLPVGRPPVASALPAATASEDNPFTFAVLSSWAPDLPPTSFRGASVSEFLQRLPVERDPYGDELPLVAVVDQFEEVFTDLPLWTVHREELLADLARAVADVERLRLLVSLKEDAVGDILPYESALSRSSRTRYRVRALDRAAALEAVTGPLRGTGRSFAPGAAEALVDRLMMTTLRSAVGERRTIRTTTVEPISLQVVCSTLWRELPDAVTTITYDHLKDHADVVATLTDHCADAVRQTASQLSVPEPVVWEWLERTFVTDLGTRNAAYEGVATTGGMPNAVARALEQARILRSERRSGSVWFELLHDSLIEPIRSGRRRVAESATGGPSDVRTDTYLLMAESALAYGMFLLAEEYAAHAVRSSQDDPQTLAEAMSFLGKLVLLRGQTEVGDRAEESYAAAEEHYRRAAELFEAKQNFRAVARVLAALGRLFSERRRFADALSALQGAVTRMPGDVDMHIDLARALRDAGQAHAALGQFESLLSVAPDAVEALVGRASIQAEHGDPAAALADLDRAIQLQPELAERDDVQAVRMQARARQGTRSPMPLAPGDEP